MHSLVPNTENIFTQTCAQTKTLLQMFIIQLMHFHTHTHARAHTHTQETDLKLTVILELCKIADQFVC